MSRFDNRSVAGMLKTDGRRMVNGRGEEVILRGWAAGNWMVPEGYMVGIGTEYMGQSFQPGLALPQRMSSRRSMTQTIRELCGSEYAKAFWPRWQAAHLDRRDIQAMAEAGYNSLRLPLAAEALLPEEPEIRFDEAGFEAVDRVLSWCEEYGIYVILDMHGAIGGHAALSCDDGLDNVPRMFMEEESRERMLLLWEEIARRYRDRWIVGGYELLNEPISPPRWHYLMPELEKFYDDAIRRIRAIDRGHIVFLEGATFSTNMQVFHREYDPECRNWCVAIHLYGYSPEVRDLYKFLEVSHRLNVPVWIGEGRGATNEDMAVFYEIAAAHHIGFNLWCWKAVESGENAGLAAYTLPEGFEAIIRYAKEGGARPSYAECKRLFDEMISRLPYDRCKINEEAHIYCQRSQGIALPAAGYDPEGFSGGWKLGNPLAFRTEDGTRLVLKDGEQVADNMPLPGQRPRKPDALRMLLLQLDKDAYASYTVRRVRTSCVPRVALRAKDGARLRLAAGKSAVEIDVPAAAGFTVIDGPVIAPCEEATLRIQCVSGTVQLEKVIFGLSASV